MLLTIVGSSHTQLQELEEKYSECIEMLHEAQEELKNLRNRSVSAGTPRRYHPLGLFPMVHKQTRSYITHARPVLLEITNACIFIFAGEDLLVGMTKAGFGTKDLDLLIQQVS